MKLFELKQLLLIMLLFGSCTDRSIAQTDQPFKDSQLEKYLQTNQLNEAEKLIEVHIAQEEKLSLEQQVYYLNRKSQVELRQGKFSESLASAKRSEKLLDSSPQSLLWGETFRAVCYAYIRTGKLDSALHYAEKLFDYSKKENNYLFGRAALVAMGNISLQNKRYQKSLDFYLEALSVSESSKDSSNLKVDNYNIGLAYAQLDEHEKSNEYLLKSAQMAETENAMDLLARAYGSIADNYLAQNNYKLQETFINKANAIAKKMGNTQLLAMGLASLAEAALQTQKYSQAIHLGQESLQHLKERPIIQLQAKLDSMLYVAYKETGDFKSALNQLESFDEKLLAIRGEAQKEKLDQLTLAFEVEKKDLRIINQEISIAEEKAKNKLLIIAVTSVSMIVTFLGFINFKNSKTRKLLFQKEKELDRQFTHSQLAIPSKTPEIAFSLEKNLNEGFDHQKLFAEVIQFIQDKKLYLDPKFNQQTLISEFGTNRQYLYEAISKSGEDNFRGIINRFRINEAKKHIEQLLKKEEAMDLSGLAEKVGFNSYATFYRAFKNLTGLTPNEFSKELKNELIEK